MDCAERAVVALGAGQQKGQCLVPSYLSDDESVGVHAEGVDGQFVHPELTDPFDVRRTGFEIDVIGVQMTEPVDAEFE